MGGDAQVQIHLQLLARILVAGQSLDDAVAAPRWTFDRTTVVVEPRLPPLEPLPAGLVSVEMPSPDMAGHAHAIRIGEGRLEAACDPRADGVAVGD
jgi:gamma-glutamyltranspeptidase/glutathione hydrolase